MSILTIENLNAGYGDLQVLKNVNLELEQGTVSILMGPNGAGKSTLLRSLYNLTDVMSGSVSFGGNDITNLHAHQLLDRGISFVSQGKVNFSTVNVRDNLFLGAHHIKDKKKIEEKMHEIFEQFPVLREQQKQLAFSLSGGQQQMLAIGRALMSSPKLLLMDEPSLGLAPKLVKELFAKIIEIRERFGTTILIVEHNLKSLMDVADYGFVLVHGEIVAHDRCSVLKESDIMQKVFVGQLD